MQICFHVTRLVSIISDCCYVASNGQLELLQQYFLANEQLQNTDTWENSRIACLTRFGHGYVSDTSPIRIRGVSEYLLFLQKSDTFLGYVSAGRYAYL
jgi:hypothetical protein